jgi:hypothetical protein
VLKLRGRQIAAGTFGGAAFRFVASRPNGRIIQRRSNA